MWGKRTGPLGHSVRSYNPPVPSRPQRRPLPLGGLLLQLLSIFTRLQPTLQFSAPAVSIFYSSSASPLSCFCVIYDARHQPSNQNVVLNLRTRLSLLTFSSWEGVMRTLVYGCYMLVPVHAGTSLSVVSYYTIPIIYSLCARSVVSSSALPSLARRARRASGYWPFLLLGSSTRTTSSTRSSTPPPSSTPSSRPHGLTACAATDHAVGIGYRHRGSRSDLGILTPRLLSRTPR